MAKRERFDTSTGKRYVRRDERGRFVRSDDVAHSQRDDPRTTTGNSSRKGTVDKAGATRATARISSFGNRPMVAVAAGLIVVTAGAVITSATLRRNSE